MNAKPLILETNEKDFEKKFLNRIRINSGMNVKVQNFVDRTIADIKNKGNSSLVSYINKYDGYKAKNINDILVTKNQINEAYTYVEKSQLLSLKKSIIRINLGIYFLVMENLNLIRI